MRLSVVVPVYKNEGSIPDLIERLELLDREMKGELEAVLVVDGSPDRSLDILAESLPGAGFRSRLLVLSRNFGSFAAIRAGLTRAEGPLFAIMAADLQEPAELILAFRERLMAGECDVVIGVREAREDGYVSRLFSALFWHVYRTLIRPEVPPGGVDVFACNTPFRDQLLSLEEHNTTLVGLVRRSPTGVCPAATDGARGPSADAFATSSTVPSPSRTYRSAFWRRSAFSGSASPASWV